MAKQKVLTEDGIHYFTVAYAAELLGTIPRKIEQLIGIGILDVVERKRARFVPEEQVTALRRDPERLRKELERQRNPRRKADPVAAPAWPRGLFSDRSKQSVLPIADYRYKRPTP